MKYPKITRLGCVMGAAFLFLSCDTGEKSSPDQTTATALDYLLVGDKISFTNTSGIASLNALIFDAPTQAKIGDTKAYYTYLKVSEHSFTLSLGGDFLPETRFPDIVDGLLGENSTLATEFRELISNRVKPDFTDEEIERMKVILNVFGADLVGENTDDLYSVAGKQYKHIITSTEADMVKGTMGGVYTLTATAKKVLFRFPNGAELNQYRFLGQDSQIPYVVSLVSLLEDEEDGTWLMEFVNSSFY